MFSIEREVKCEQADCAHPLPIQLSWYEQPLFGSQQRGVTQEGMAG
jgi:hypothetical protein